MNRNLWDALSQDVVQIESINRFIKSLDKLYVADDYYSDGAVFKMWGENWIHCVI